MKKQHAIFSLFFASIMISSLLVSILLVPVHSVAFNASSTHTSEFSESINFHKKFISESTETGQQPIEKGYEQDESEELGEKDDFEPKSFHQVQACLINKFCCISKLKLKETNQVADYKQSISLPLYILYQSSKLDIC